jgi:hypothetical protein
MEVGSSAMMDRRIGDYGAREGHTLPLPAGERGRAARQEGWRRRKLHGA